MTTTAVPIFEFFVNKIFLFFANELGVKLTPIQKNVVVIVLISVVEVLCLFVTGEDIAPDLLRQVMQNYAITKGLNTGISEVINKEGG